MGQLLEPIQNFTLYVLAPDSECFLHFIYWVTVRSDDGNWPKAKFGELATHHKLLKFAKSSAQFNESGQSSAATDPPVQAASNIISVLTKSYAAYSFASKAGCSQMYLVVWRKELTDIEIDENMNQERHCFQKPKNFVRTLRKWISDKFIYLTVDEISGFALHLRWCPTRMLLCPLSAMHCNHLSSILPSIKSIL